MANIMNTNNQNAGKCAGEMEPLSTVGGNVNYSLYEFFSR
jgi:hypothetical protein